MAEDLNRVCERGMFLRNLCPQVLNTNITLAMTILGAAIQRGGPAYSRNIAFI